MGKTEEVTGLLADDWLTPGQLAARLGQTEATLAKWRTQHGGPAFLKIGRKVFYPREEVEAWLRSKLRTGPPETAPLAQGPARPGPRRGHRFGGLRTKRQKAEEALQT